MTVLLVMFLILTFVGTDQLVRAASRRAAAQRGALPLQRPGAARHGS